MTKRMIVDELVAQHADFAHRTAEMIVSAVFDEMARAMARGARVEIRGFGSFAVRVRRARQGRNPRTHEVINVPAKRIPFFRAGKDLKLEVNDGAAHHGPPATG